MRRAIRVLVAVGGGIVLLLILGTIVLRLLLPPAKIRQIVQEQTRKHFNREVQMNDISLGLGGLRLSRFRLSEVPSFSGGTFLAVENVELRWAIRPLLSKQLHILTVLLEKPQLTIIRFAEGNRLSISDLAGATAGASEKSLATSAGLRSAPTVSGEKTKSPWKWRIHEIHLLQGMIQFNDRSKARQTSALTGIDLTLRNFDPTKVDGRLTVAHVDNPVYSAKSLSVEWSLRQIDPTLSKINGWLRLKQGAAIIQNLEQLTDSSSSARLLLIPFITLQKLDRTGVMSLGLPDLRRIALTGIDGDYSFKDGQMAVNRFHLEGPQLVGDATGTAQLPKGALALDVQLRTPDIEGAKGTDIKLKIGGTLEHPTTDLKSLKTQAFRATLKKVLQDPDVLKKIKIFR